MKKADYDDKALILDILTESFKNNRSVNYIASSSGNNEDKVRALMDYSFEVCRRFGDVYLSDDREAVALVLYPDRKKTNLSMIMLDVKLVLNCIGIANIGKALKRESSIKKLQPQVPMYYLWFIGVHPDKQGRGIGSQLMNELILESQKMKRPVYLETSTLTNIPWYKKFGFDIYNELNLSYNLYFLNRGYVS
ncbi:GNAT family N-acetyltransferase [Albibacterium indicum]|uniref:GNAT family N-acetyltransferase n=1 Tax=Albibacterium indicum TaxID=2292082 RepID=UPI000E4B3F63|nr:GNAT family N-acetyltransferase [Pedobacter indicus]